MLKWSALIVALFLPLAFAPQSWLLAYLAQTATMIVFALSYNLLLGETGLLSFGHAAYAGLGAFAAAHAFNRYGVALPLVPLIGGAAGACAWFGGEGGVSVDRASGPPFFTWTFGPAREAYALIAVWCVIACIAMYAFSRTPTVRLANAVRDNATRVASIGFDPRRVRFTMSVVSAFFAGIAGAMSLINVELASAEGVGLARSGSVLIATVIGGTSSFFGPVAGAALLTFFSVAVASVSPAWLMYLGLVFVWIVVAAPDGLCGLSATRRTPRLALAAAAWGLAVVIASETAYAMQFDGNGDGVTRLGSITLDGRTLMPWLAAFGCAVLAALLTRGAKR
jgi:branched-chain amino acid transport system permease protein